MKILIIKSKNTICVYKETTIQSIITDGVSALVMALLIGLDILFSKLVGRSLVLDVTVCLLLFMYLMKFAINKKQEVTVEELKSEIEKFCQTENKQQ